MASTSGAKAGGELTSNSDARPVSPGPTREEVGDDYWDPPCHICKVVDDEPNVLCELCNDAYHIACLGTLKSALPRSPEDDEWFCRTCVRRGVPEVILDRVGRCVCPPSRHHCPACARFAFPLDVERARRATPLAHGTLAQGLVGALLGQVAGQAVVGRILGGGQAPRHSLEPVRGVLRVRARVHVRVRVRACVHACVHARARQAASTDTTLELSRHLPRSKLIREYVGKVEPSRRSVAQLLPPCHPLVDMCRGRATVEAAAAAAAAAAATAAVPPAATQAAGQELLTTLRALCVRLPRSHALGPLAVAAARLARVQSHARCVTLAPWADAHDDARQAANAAVKRAADALAPISAVGSSLGKRNTARRKSAVQQALALSRSEAANSRQESPRSGRGGRGGGGNREAVRLRLRGSEDAEDGAPGGSVATRGKAEDAEHAEHAEQAPAPTSPSEALADLPRDDDEACAALAAELQSVCARLPSPAHFLAPVALPVAKVLVTFESAGWTAHEDVVARGVQALTALRATLDNLIGAPPPAAAAPPTAAAAAASCAPNAYRSFLQFLSESRQGSAVAAAASPDAAAELEARVASEFAKLPPADRAALDERALQTYRSRLGSLPNELAGLERRGGRADGGRADERGACAKGHGSRKPCGVCAEYDKRDALVCGTCGGRTHLMCLFPPMELAYPRGPQTLPTLGLQRRAGTRAPSFFPAFSSPLAHQPRLRAPRWEGRRRSGRVTTAGRLFPRRSRCQRWATRWRSRCRSRSGSTTSVVPRTRR